MLQHDGLPDRVTRLQEELDDLRKSFANENRENEQTTTQHAAHNAELLKQIAELRGELENLEHAKQTEAATAARSLRAAEASFNNELARIEGQRLRQEETTQENLKEARQEAFAHGETAKTLAAALDASKADVESLKQGMHLHLHCCWRHSAILQHICSSAHGACDVCHCSVLQLVLLWHQVWWMIVVASPHAAVDLSTTEFPTRQNVIPRRC